MEFPNISFESKNKFGMWWTFLLWKMTNYRSSIGGRQMSINIKYGLISIFFVGLFLKNYSVFYSKALSVLLCRIKIASGNLNWKRYLHWNLLISSWRSNYMSRDHACHKIYIKSFMFITTICFLFRLSSVQVNNKS